MKINTTSRKRPVALYLILWSITAPGMLGAQTCTPPPDGITAWWPGDRHSLDLTGTNHGVPAGGPGFVSGKVGLSFALDGASQFIRLANTEDLNPAGDFSIAAWILPTRSANQVILGKWGDEGDYANQRSYTLMLTANGAIQFAISDAAHQTDTAFHIFNTAANAIPLNDWTHVVAAYQKSTGTRRIYLNGILSAGRTDAPITVLQGVAEAGLGAYLRQSNEAAAYFSGQIDEVEFYHRNLSPGEIAAIHGAGSAGQCRPPFPAPAGLTNWWSADAGFLDRIGPNEAAAVGPVGFVPGPVGHAFDFNGAGSYLAGPPVLTKAAAFSFSWWMKIRNFNHPNYMMVFSQDPPALMPSSPGLNFMAGNGGLSFGLLGYWTDGTFFDMRTDIPFGAGVWKQITVTCDGGLLKQYVDGVLLNTGTYSGKTLGNAHPFLIGKGYAYPSGIERSTTFDGQLDEFMVYDRALGADEIAASFAAGSAGIFSPNASFGPGLRAGVTIRSVSSEFPSAPWELVATHLIDGSGLSGTPAVHAQNNPTQRNSWQTSEQTGTAELQFDLGDAVLLNHLHIWNLNFYTPYNGRGARAVRISTSLDAAAWTTAVPQMEFPMATGLDGDPGFQVCATTWPVARFVRLEILSNWGGNDNAGHVGLSEVRFHTVNPAAPPFVITRLERLPQTNEIAITFPAAAGLRYGIEWSENLISWHEATTVEIPADDAALKVTLPGQALENRRSFRVRTCLPQPK